jgi:hypothetical protein
VFRLFPNFFHFLHQTGLSTMKSGKQLKTILRSLQYISDSMPDVTPAHEIKIAKKAKNYCKVHFHLNTPSYITTHTIQFHLTFPVHFSDLIP